MVDKNSVSFLFLCPRRSKPGRMEEECGDILMSTLIESGVSIPGDFSSVSQFTSEALASICAQLLNLIDPSAASEMIRVVDSLPDIAHSVKNLGYMGDISYHKFLHPSQDDSFRPKVENFRDISDHRMVKLKEEEDNDETFDMHIHKVEAVLKDLTMTPDISPSHAENASADGSTLPNQPSSGYEEHSSIDPSETTNETVELQNQHNLLLGELESGSSELRSLDCQLELLTMAAETLLDEKQPGGLYLQQLNQQLVLKRCNIMDLKKQWDDVRLTLEAKKLCLLDQLHVEEPEAKEKFHKLKKIEFDLQSLSSETQKREEERCNLYSELERQPKAASRKSYIHGIKEITKNSRKLDSDIQRISGETRELQLESNSIQERLHRSYAVVDEMVTRELKKDPSIRQVYKLVTSIHGIFGQISEKILMTDRLRREAVDYEKKLGSIASRGSSLEKLQADLDAIRQENQSLEKQLK
ncbi:coiled-coil domain-containing protein 22 isoform X2 [Brassica napus]|uniref:coiled-coil domain-containing protein 22 isoform X2 n=1 Tax=Brassica napus TaxID=3708 RepID=UPI0006AA92F1|nr:coiled-coil domain-containing protein 22 isoform X2 [Brassica napus]